MAYYQTNIDNASPFERWQMEKHGNCVEQFIGIYDEEEPEERGVSLRKFDDQRFIDNVSEVYEPKAE